MLRYSGAPLSLPITWRRRTISRRRNSIGAVSSTRTTWRMPGNRPWDVTSYGFIIAAFALSPWFKLSVLLMGLVGVVHVTSHALAQTVIQTYSPKEFRGRTMALYHMTHVILLLGGILIGALASWIGAQWATAILSLAGTLSMAVIYLALPRARLIR